MTVKLLGSEFNAFMADKSFWHDGRWYEEAVLSINGGEFFDWDGEAIAPTDQIRWQGGTVYDNGDIGSTHYNLEAKLRAWLRACVVTTVVIEIDKAHFDSAILAIKNTTGVRVL